MRLIKWLFVIAMTLAVLLALLPVAGKYYALHWFDEQGYDAKIKSLRLNPFTGKVTLVGFDVAKTAEQGLRIDRLEASVKFSQVLQKELIIRRFKTEGVRLDIGRVDADIARVIHPVERFINRYMPAWRFEIINSVHDNAELCRTGELDSNRKTATGQVSYKRSSQCLSVGNASIIGAALQNTAKGWQLSTRSVATFKRIYFKDHAKGTSLMYVGDLEISDVLIDNTERRIGQLALQSFYLVERNEQETERLDAPYQTQIQSLLISDISQTRLQNISRINLGMVDITALRQTLHRNRNAGFVMIERLGQVFPAFNAVFNREALAAQEGALPTTQFVVTVLKTRVVDGGVAWLDDSVSPPAQEAMSGLSFELGRVSSGEPLSRAPVVFEAALGESGAVKVEGFIAPFAQRSNFELKGNVKGLDMGKLSAYSAMLFNETVRQGILDAKFEIAAQAARFQGNAAIRLTGLETTGGANRSGVLSLQNAFNKLKTKNNAVDFDAYFDFDQLKAGSIAEVMGADLKRTLSDLANGRISKPRQVAASSKTGMSFEPLKYNPKTETLIGAQAIRLNDIIALAKQSPNKRLTLCPITTGGEWAALYRQGKKLKLSEKIPSVEHAHLMNMSVKRAKILRNTLVSAGLSEARFSVCQSRVELTNDGPSYVSAVLR